MLPQDFLYVFYVDLTKSQSLRSCGSISLKTILIFPKNFLNFWLNTIEKLDILTLNSYSSKIYTSIVFSDSKNIFLQEEGGDTFI